MSRESEGNDIAVATAIFVNFGRRSPGTPFNLRVVTRRNHQLPPTSAMDEVELEDHAEDGFLEDTSYQVLPSSFLLLRRFR